MWVEKCFMLGSGGGAETPKEPPPLDAPLKDFTCL